MSAITSASFSSSSNGSARTSASSSSGSSGMASTQASRATNGNKYVQEIDDFISSLESLFNDKADKSSFQYKLKYNLYARDLPCLKENLKSLAEQVNPTTIFKASVESMVDASTRSRSQSCESMKIVNQSTKALKELSERIVKILSIVDKKIQDKA